MIRVRDAAGRFRSSTDGGVAIMFGLTFLVLLGAVALAVDGARTYNAQGRVMAALDAAALAGAKLLAEDNAQASDVNLTVQKYFDAYMKQQNRPDIRVAPLNIVTDTTTKTVVATADGKIAATIGKAVGRDDLNFRKKSEVTYAIRKIEFAMALDITGSMNENGRLSNLKTAAKDVIETLLQDSVSESATRIAVVPWAASVNAGSYAAAASGGAGADNCVIERTGSEAATDSPPGGAASVRRMTTPAYGNYTCPTAPIMPLKGKSERDALKNYIDGMEGRGATAGHIGAAWGWYVLSERWNGIFTGPSKPEPNDPKKVGKNVLIMSDGKFNTSFKSGTALPSAEQVDESYVAVPAAVRQHESAEGHGLHYWLRGR